MSNKMVPLTIVELRKGASYGEILQIIPIYANLDSVPSKYLDEIMLQMSRVVFIVTTDERLAK